MATAKPSVQRRRANQKAAKRERRRIRSIKGIWPEVDAEYCDWIRGLPCVVCLIVNHLRHGGTAASGLLAFIDVITHPHEFPIERFGAQCAHVGEIRGIGQKCSDRETAPLCGKHHDRGAPEGHHDLGKGFWSFYGIDREALIAALNEAWESH